MKAFNHSGSASAFHDMRCASNRTSLTARLARGMILCAFFWSGSAVSSDCSTIGTSSLVWATLPLNAVVAAADGFAVGIQVPGSTSGAGSAALVYTASGASKECLVDEAVVSPYYTAIPNFTFQTASGSASVFETDIPGVGFAVEARFDSGNWQPIGSEPSSLKPKWSSTSNGAIEARVTYVITGSLKSGNFDAGRKYLFNYSMKYKGQEMTALRSSGSLDRVKFNASVRTCRVTSGAANTVVMPTLAAPSLKAVGDVASARSAPFSIALQCDRNLNVYATLSDATDPTNTTNILSLSEKSTAKGVGIQILKKGTATPLSFGPDTAAKGNTNQWYVERTLSSPGAITVPFEARYIKTAPVIMPGVVSALSTITFSYQ